MKWFLGGVAFWLVFSVTSAGALEGKQCHVYQFECLPSVGKVNVRVHHVNCSVISHPYGTTNEALAADNIYFADIKGENDRNKHECTVRGRKVQIEMDALFFNPDQHSINCVNNYEYIIRTNWWLDGKKVVKNLRFLGGCNHESMFLGTFIREITALIPYEENPHKDKGNSGPFSSDIYFDIRDISDTMFKFAVDITPPYQDLSAEKHRSYLNGIPLTNIHIHGEDGEGFILPKILPKYAIYNEDTENFVPPKILKKKGTEKP